MAEIGYGITLYVSDAAPDTTADNVVAGVMTVTPPSPTRDIIDVSSSDSPGMAREFIAGMIDYGEVTAEILWVPGTAADVLLRTISLERSPRTYKITWSQLDPDVSITFLAFLTAFERTSPLDDKMTASITLKVTGAPSYS
jgi:predicted secreted protein